MATPVLIAVIGLGSVLFFLGSTAEVYEEAEMWGAAFALGAFYALIGFMQKPTVGRLVSTGLLTTLVYAYSGSVGAGPLVAVGLVLAVYLLAFVATAAPRLQPAAERLARSFGVEVARSSGRFVAGLTAAIGVPAALYVAVNEVKFGTLFSIPDRPSGVHLESAHRQAVLAANGGSLFGLKFIPTNLLQFVRPDALSVTRLFPWMFFPGKAFVLGNLLYDERDWTSSVPSSMPVLFLLALVGDIRRVQAREGPLVGFGRACDPQASHCRCRCGNSGHPHDRLHRPALPRRRGASSASLVRSLVGTSVGRAAGILLQRDRLVLSCSPCWLLFGCWTSFSLSLFYQRELGPVVTIPERAGMVAFQQQVNRALFGGQLLECTVRLRLPANASALDLAVLGDCRGVYQYDGNTWEPVELGPGGGALRLSVTFVPPSRAGASLFSSPAARLRTLWRSHGREPTYSFSYLFDGTLVSASARNWYPEQAVAVAPGPHQVQIDLVSQLGMVYITLDGNPVFSLLYPVAPPTVTELGSAPASLQTTGSFAGSVRSLPVPTPICHGLERRAGVPAC